LGMVEWRHPEKIGRRVLKDQERWMELAELASKEQDPEKLMALIAEINQFLAEKQESLNKKLPRPSD